MATLFLILASGLVAFGGLMAADDAALNTLSRAEMQELAAGSRNRRTLISISADPGAHVNAVNFLRVLAETGAAVLVTIVIAGWLDSPWLVLLIAAVAMTAVSFLLVGASPRSVGRVHARVVLRWSAPVVRGARLLLGPVANVLVRLGNLVTPGRPRSGGFTSEEQLLSMVDEATELAVLEQVDRDLIHSVFEWGETVVREVMIPRTDMVTIEGTASAAAGLDLLLSRGLSRLPVVEHDADGVLGVLHLRDLTRLVHERPDAVPRVSVSTLARPALFIPDSKKADETMRLMQVESNHLSMVVDEYGGIAGLVTLEDLIEELVGEISDEYDREGPGIEAIGDGVYRVSARLPLDELGDLFGLEVDDEDVETAGGLLTKELGRLPVRGATADVAGLRLTADRTDGRRRRLTTLLVERDPDAAVDDEDAVRSVGA